VADDLVDELQQTLASYDRSAPTLRLQCLIYLPSKIGQAKLFITFHHSAGQTKHPGGVFGMIYYQALQDL